MPQAVVAGVAPKHLWGKPLKRTMWITWMTARLCAARMRTTLKLPPHSAAGPQFTGFVSVRGARTHNLKHADVDIPRDALVVFTGVSGSGKSSLAFGTLYAEAQRRYLESVAPYARRLFHQLDVPVVDAIDGLPPAVALQQQRGAPTTRSSVGTVTTLSNLLRMLYSRAGTYPPGQGILYAEAFSPNTPEGACPTCHGLGRVYDATEASMVRDHSLSIREGAVAAWPGAWQGQNLRDILTTLGIDIDTPWRELPKKDRDWVLFTDEQPQVPVWPHYSRVEVLRAQKRKERHDYLGTFVGARRYVLDTFAKTDSARMKRRAAQFLVSADCPACCGKRLRPEPLSVTFAGLDITEMSRQPLSRLATLFRPYATSKAKFAVDHPEKAEVARRIAEDLEGRLGVLLDLGLGYLTLERSTPTLSPGELQRLRLATQVRSNLFGVVYVLDEPSAGLHPADTQALLRALDRLKTAGNSLFRPKHSPAALRCRPGHRMTFAACFPLRRGDNETFTALAPLLRIAPLLPRNCLQTVPEPVTHPIPPGRGLLCLRQRLAPTATCCSVSWRCRWTSSNETP